MERGHMIRFYQTGALTSCYVMKGNVIRGEEWVHPLKSRTPHRPLAGQKRLQSRPPHPSQASRPPRLQHQRRHMLPVQTGCPRLQVRRPPQPAHPQAPPPRVLSQRRQTRAAELSPRVAPPLHPALRHRGLQTKPSPPAPGGRSRRAAQMGNLRYQWPLLLCHPRQSPPPAGPPPPQTGRGGCVRGASRQPEGNVSQPRGGDAQSQRGDAATVGGGAWWRDRPRRGRKEGQVVRRVRLKNGLRTDPVDCNLAELSEP